MKKAKGKVAHHSEKASPARLEMPSVEIESKEFPHYQKNDLWFVGMGLLLLVGLILTVRAGDYLASAVVIALALAIFRLASIRPARRQVRITVRGVYWGKEFFPYHHLKAFWVTGIDGQYTVYLERPNFAPTLHFMVPEAKIDAAAGLLSLLLPLHTHRGEPVPDRLNRFLRI